VRFASFAFFVFEYDDDHRALFQVLTVLEDVAPRASL
jgi:hypothetical protein